MWATSKIVKKVMNYFKQIILEVDLEHKEFKYHSIVDNKLVTLLNPSVVSCSDFISALDVAAKDNRVKALVCRFGGIQPGTAAIEDMREAVVRFRAAGKMTIAYADTITDNAWSSYLFASAFEKIYLSRSGFLNISGLGFDHPFIKKTLEKCGIEPRILQREEYKNAANLFNQEKFTEPHKESLVSLMSELFSNVTKKVAEARGRSQEEVEELFLRGPMTAKEALEAGLVDGLLYRDEIYKLLSEQFPKATYLYTHKYILEKKKQILGRKGKHKVALIEANGSIHDGSSEKDMFTGERHSIGSDSTCADIRAAIADKSVKGIIFRVDSGGGSYSASDAIARELIRAKEAGKPVIAWMGNAAASGGYLISMYADAIVAQNMTLTGSIGVVMGKLLLNGLADKIGVTFDRADARDHGEHGTIFSSIHDFTEEQAQRMNDIIDLLYEEFKEDAAKARNIEKKTMDSLAKGRVWTGSQALERKLVDRLGDIHEVVDVLKEKMKLKEKDTIQFVQYPKISFLNALLKPANSSLDEDKRGGSKVSAGNLFRSMFCSFGLMLLSGSPSLQLVFREYMQVGVTSGPTCTSTPISF